MNCDEPHLVPNKKTQPIQWTKRPTGALVVAGSLWPRYSIYQKRTGDFHERIG
jgi:hypothetical protein